MKKIINYSMLFDCIRDAYSIIPKKLAEGLSFPPLRYSLELTYKCNLNCPYCYIGESRNKNELSSDEWIKVINQIPAWSLITLVGGEPLVRKDFAEIFSKSASTAKVNVVTNGILLNDEIIDLFINKKLLLLSVSLDGYGENHDKNRGKEGIFDTVINNLEKLNSQKQEKNLPMVDIKTIVLENNLDDLVKIYKLCSEMKFEFISIAFLRANSLKQNSVLRDSFEEEFYKTQYPIKPYFDMKHFEEVYKEIQSLSKKSATVIRYAPKFAAKDELNQIEKLFAENTKEPSEIYQPCLYPWSNIHINPEGDIYPCLSYKIGNVRNTEINKIWNSKKFCNFRQNLKKEKLFSACQMCCELKVRNKK
jgi:MoaA/NifB/PqqE/SkfB family radical SAM enzyme